jgi:hypothetical protein
MGVYYVRVSYNKVLSHLGCSTSRREVSGYSVSSYLGTHKNYGKFRGNYHSRVLMLLDFRTRMIVPQCSAQS